MKTRGISSLAVAAAAGAALAYFFDRTQGARRRAVVQDKVRSGLLEAERAGEAAAEDFSNRLRGAVASLRGRLAPEPVSDEVLAERVRARLGRVSMHPGSIDVTVDGGSVTLTGPVLKREAGRVVRAAAAVTGIHSVIDRLEVHERADNIPGLQGGQPRQQRIDILRENWAPGTRMLAAGGGALAALSSLARPSLASPVLLGAGLALIARAVTNTSLRRLLGRAGRRGIDFTKTVHIAAPLEMVYETWADFENFPRFMRNVRAVRRNQDGSWHWEVAGPAGTTVEWDSEVTRSEPGELLAWATLPGQAVEHAGIVRFQRDGGGTRIHVQMTYNPPAGAVGHVAASLFGADPATELDEDLMRLKSWFETGKLPRDAAVH